jgi:hypothetical protein
MNTFKFNLNAVLSSLLKGYTTNLTAKAKEDIRIWINRLNHPTQWNPICPEKSEPPLTSYSFTSDRPNRMRGSGPRRREPNNFGIPNMVARRLHQKQNGQQG